MLTKVNLSKRGWQGDINCLFCGQPETVDHLFVTCSFIFAIWDWIASYNSFTYNCTNIDDLWILDAYIPLKDKKLLELIRGAVLWTVWIERNNMCFQNKNPRIVQGIASSIVALASFWCQSKQNDSYFKLSLILPFDTTDLAQVEIIEVSSSTEIQERASSMESSPIPGIDPENLNDLIRDTAAHEMDPVLLNFLSDDSGFSSDNWSDLCD